MMRNRACATTLRIVFGIAMFAVLAGAILREGPKQLIDFDQSFYITAAYDLGHYGVFSNGVFDDVKSSTGQRPPSGMFFAPLYPLTVLLATKLDPRFARAADCSVEANEDQRDIATCEAYARPVLLLHALMLALAVCAIGMTAELIFPVRGMFFLAGGLATIGLAAEADLFSFVMTESLTICMFSLAAAAWIFGLRNGSARLLGLAGILLGLLILTRASYLVLIPVMGGVILLAPLLGAMRWRAAIRSVLMFAAALVVVVLPWVARNGIVVGKWGMSEEYGAAALVERFAYDDMTPREYALAFPHCLPVVGPAIIDRIFGRKAMLRLQWNTDDSFFQIGRARRNALVAEHKRLDPIIASLVRDELAQRGWRYLLVSLPLAWCGLWVGHLWSVLLMPLFLWASIAAFRERNALFGAYVLPTLAMVALHGLVANHYSRYNLILIGPIAAAAAWIVLARIAPRLRPAAAAVRK